MIKKLFFALAALLPLGAMAQTNGTFTVKGKVGNLNAPARAYLFYQLGANKVVDSAAITNGSFEITGTVFFPVNAGLVIDHEGIGINQLATRLNASPQGKPDAFSFYLEKGLINVSSATDSVSKAEVIGSPINDDNKKLTAQLDLIREKGNKLVAEVQAASAEQQKAPDFQAGVQRRYKALQTEQENALKNFIKGNPNSYLSLLALSSLGGPKADPAVLEPLYNSLSGDVKGTETGKQLYAAIQELKATAIGQMAPDFTQNDIHGIPVKLSSFRGKYVLIDFWASWCPPCRQENPNVVRVFNKYKTKKFTILGVSLDKPDAREAWISAVKNDGLAWTQVSDLKYWDNTAAALYHVTSIPQNFLIDPTGKIIAKDLRGEDLENKLAEIFGKI